MVLLLGNAPQQLLHDLFSDHDDITTGCSHSQNSGCYHADFKFCGNELVYIGNDFHVVAFFSANVSSRANSVIETELTDHIREGFILKPGNKGPPTLA